MGYIEYAHRRKSSRRGRNGCCTKSGNKKSLSDKAPLASALNGRDYLLTEQAGQDSCARFRFT